MAETQDALARWVFTEQEKQATVDWLEPLECTPTRHKGLSMDMIAGLCLVVGGGMLVVTRGQGELAGLWGIGALFGVVWFPLKVLGRLGARAHHRRLMKGPAEVVVFPESAVIFGERHTWKLAKCKVNDEFKEAHLDTRDNRTLLVIEYTFLSTRGSSELQRKPATLDVPVPAAMVNQAGLVARKLNELKAAGQGSH